MSMIFQPTTWILKTRPQQLYSMSFQHILKGNFGRFFTAGTDVWPRGAYCAPSISLSAGSKQQMLSLRSSLPFLRLVKVRSQASLPTLISAMAGAGEDFSSLSGNVDAVPVDSSNSQIDGGADDLKYGFQRPEMYKSALAGTVDPYDRHIFLCYRNAESWPSRVEGADYDPLPRLLAAALKSRKNEINGNTRLTICEGGDGTETESLDGDILIFPEMVRYRGLTQSDVDNFVEDVLVKGVTWASGAPETLTGSHVFVCAHGSRDRRCGVCGPVLIDKLKEEAELRGLKDQVFVTPCSHIGGHKYAGNLIIFSPNSEGIIEGHWYGYVTPEDVPVLLDQHIGNGKIIEQLWRGQMGSINEEEKTRIQKIQEIGGMANGTDLVKRKKEPQGSNTKANMKDGGSCCQGSNGFSCCQDEKVEEVNSGIAEKKQRGDNNASAKKGFCSLSTWEQGDILTAVAVIGAVAFVAVAFSFYRRSA